MSLENTKTNNNPTLLWLTPDIRQYALIILMRPRKVKMFDTSVARNCNQHFAGLVFKVENYIENYLAKCFTLEILSRIRQLW